MLPMPKKKIADCGLRIALRQAQGLEHARSRTRRAARSPSFLPKPSRARPCALVYQRYALTSEHDRRRHPLAALRAVCAFADEPPASPEFFEKNIRPVLSEQCYKCHSSTATKLKGGLMLDSREAMLKGGDTGPAVAPGDLDKSLLIEAIRWHNTDMQMPPKKALAPEQVANLEAWVKAGAPWPQEAIAKAATKKVFDLQKRKQDHWCWQPIHESAPPDVKAAAWPANAVDHFILAKLEEKGLSPAPDADRRTWLRRVTFDLTGLPPTPGASRSLPQRRLARSFREGGRCAARFAAFRRTVGASLARSRSLRGIARARIRPGPSQCLAVSRLRHSRAEQRRAV